MSDYRRWDGAPPASGSYQPPRYESGPNYRPDFDGDRRRNEPRDVPRYRNDPPVAAPSASRHAVRVDFDDFDRGSYRSPSPLRYPDFDIKICNCKNSLNYGINIMVISNSQI